MIKRILQLALLALTATQIAVALAKTHWFLELFTHYPHYYILAAALLLPFLTWKRMWKNCLLLALIIAINLATIAPYLETNHITVLSTDQAEESISILTSNFFYNNDEFGEFSDLLNAEDPDIFIIHEASELWRIDPKSQFYNSHPYEYKSLESGIAGIFVASKYPAQFAEVELGSKFGVEITLESEDKSTNLTILAVHPRAPITAAYAQERNAQMEDIALYAQSMEAAGRNLIVTGDFNCTPFSPYFQDMLEASGLQDARLSVGTGILTTWHAHSPFFQIPIDHTLVSPKITVLDFRRTAALSGSDHWPILAEILLP